MATATLKPLQPALDSASSDTNAAASTGVSPLSTADDGVTGASAGAGTAGAGSSEPQISSPHELTDWVDNVLNSLESRFATMSEQVETRMKEMADRIDALESSIEELITGAVAPVASAGNLSNSSSSREGERAATATTTADPKVRISEPI